MVAKRRLGGDTGAGLFMGDTEAGQRVFGAPAAAGPT